MTRTKTLDMGGGLRLPLDVVTRRTTILGQTDTGKTSTAVVMVEEAARQGAQQVVIDPTGAWWGLTSNAAGDGPGLDFVVMGGRHGDVPLDEHSGREVARLVANEGYNLVLDLDRLRSWAARQRFTADFCSELYEQAHSQIFVVMDEAHRLAPQGRLEENGHAARCLGAVSDMVLLGRRRGISTLLVCQRPAKLNKDVLEMSEVLIAHRVRGNNDRAQIRGWIEEHDLDVKALLAEVAGLAKGVARVSAPTIGINGTYTIRPKQTFDSSRTIGVGEVEIQPKVRAEVDMDDLRERMRATIEKAIADEPRTLRARIRDLEKQIRDQPAPDPVEIEVQVPFIPPEIVTGIRSLVGQVSGLGDVVTRMSESLDAAPTRPTVVPRRPTSAGPSGPPPAPTPGVGRIGKLSALLPPARDNGRATGPKQRILDALAALRQIGVEHAPKVQVALFAGASPKSSSFANNVSSLRTAGLIDYPSQGFISLTDEGIAQANSAAAPATVEEMWAYAEQLVRPAKWKLLSVLLNAYPDAISKADLALGAGVSANSSSFANNLSSLRSLGLIDYPLQGMVAARPILMLEA